MTCFEMGTEIDRPVEKVFVLLCDVQNDPNWRREWVGRADL